MKKQARITGIDCPVCAKKLEAEIAKLEGITFAEINFLAEKLTIETDDNYSFDNISDNIIKCAKDFEPESNIIGLKRRII